MKTKMLKDMIRDTFGKSVLFGLTAFIFVGLFAGTMNAVSPGALDLSFANRGILSFSTIPSVQNTRIEAIINQPDGKLIAVGQGVNCNGSNCGSDDFVIVRYNADGSYDTSFGTNGVVIYDHVNQNEGATAVALQPDGKIVVVGGRATYTRTPSVTGFKVLRFMPDGAVDSSFGTNGFVYENFNNSGGDPKQVFIQSNGKILVVGKTQNQIASLDYTLFFARLDANGTMDSSFGSDGIFTKNVTLGSVKFAKQSDDKLIVAGSNGGLMLSRYNTNGALDNSFGNNGTVTYSLNEAGFSAIAVQPDDKIIISGSHGYSANKRFPVIVRFNADGTQDASFVNNNGEIRQYYSYNYCFRCTERAFDIELLPDGRFYVAGSSSSTVSTVGFFSVSRYLSNGTIDPSFGFRGSSYVRLLKIISSSSDYDMSIKPDGTINTSLNYPNLITQLYPTITPATVRGDFDGDKKTDFAVYRPSNNYWYVSRSSDGGFSPYYFGANGDLPLSGDFDYDKKIDLGIFRPSNNLWSFQPVVDNGPGTMSGGFYSTLNTDVRLPEDYDGDGFTDVAYFRPSNGTWYFKYSSSIIYDIPDETIQFGQNGDIPVPGDYDGDGRTDIAVFRPSNGAWYILRSSDYGVTATVWGLGTDKLVPGDYDGDGRTDIAVFRDGNWYVLRSSDNGFLAVNWGLGTDKLVPGDYNGDGKYDFGVYRPSNGTWFILNSSDYSFKAYNFGLSDDIPIPFLATR